MNWSASKSSAIVALALGLFGWSGLGQTLPTGPQRTFASATDAAAALLHAAKTHDRQAMGQLFGPEVTNLITGDAILDERHFDEFASDLGRRCDPVPQGPDQIRLEIGPEAWPFPIPLVRTNGAWVFDTVAGEEEIMNRHIGRDEYYAIGVCRAYVKAQLDYAQRSSGSG